MIINKTAKILALVFTCTVVSGFAETSAPLITKMNTFLQAPSLLNLTHNTNILLAMLSLSKEEVIVTKKIIDNALDNAKGKNISNWQSVFRFLSQLFSDPFIMLIPQSIMLFSLWKGCCKYRRSNIGIFISILFYLVCFFVVYIIARAISVGCSVAYERGVTLSAIKFIKKQLNDGAITLPKSIAEFIFSFADNMSFKQAKMFIEKLDEFNILYGE